MNARAVTLLVLLIATPAFAADESEMEALSKLAKDDPKRAAGVVKLVAKARKTMALDCQQSLAKHVFDLVPMKDGRADPASLLPRLGRLDDPKSFAFFSAHHLAYPALLGATASGNYDGLQPALALALKRDGAKYGAYAQAMADYAKGIQAQATPLEAIKSFELVLAACAKHGWSKLALHSGLELTLARVAAEDPEAAKRTMQDTFAAVREDADAPVLYSARTMVGNRLRDNHTALHAAWDDVLATRLKGYSRGGGAGAGGAGRTSMSTPIGKVMKKWRKRKPIIGVTRTGDEFQIEYEFGDLPDKVHKRGAGITHVDAGGVVLAFYQGGIRLQQVSPNNEAVGGANAAPGRWQKFDPLADGERWLLYATGEVRFK